MFVLNLRNDWYGMSTDNAHLGTYYHSSTSGNCHALDVHKINRGARAGKV